MVCKANVVRPLERNKEKDREQLNNEHFINEKHNCDPILANCWTNINKGALFITALTTLGRGWQRHNFHSNPNNNGPKSAHHWQGRTFHDNPDSVGQALPALHFE